MDNNGGHYHTLVYASPGNGGPLLTTKPSLLQGLALESPTAL